MPENSIFLESSANRQATLYFYDNLVECGDSDDVQRLLLDGINNSGVLAGTPQRKRGLISSLALSLALDIYGTQQSIRGLDFYRDQDWE